MAFVTSSLSAGELAAEAAGSPLFIAKNALEIGLATRDHEWHTGASGVQLDVTDPDLPSHRAHDGQPHVYTSPEDSTDDTYYLTFYLDGTQTIDAVAIQLAQSESDSVNVTVRLANSFLSSTNITTIASFSAVPGNARLLALNLNSHTRYSTVPELQVQITQVSGTTVPKVSQVFAGRRRQLTRAMLPGFDAESLESYADESGGLTSQRRIAHATGFRNLDGEYMANIGSANSMFGLDDAATIRAIYDDSNQGRSMLVYVDRPDIFANSGAPHYFEWGYIDTDARLDVTDYAVRDWHFSFTEVPPKRGDEIPPVVVPYVNTQALRSDSGIVDVDFGTTLAFDGLQNFTLAFWIAHSHSTSWSTTTLLAASASSHLRWRVNTDSSNRLILTLSNNGTTLLSGFGPSGAGGQPFDGTPHLWVFTFDGTQASHWGTTSGHRGRCYKDGASVAWSSASATAPASLHSSSGSPAALLFTNNASGLITLDSPAFWPVTATPAQVSELYNGGASLNFLTTTLGTPLWHPRFDGNYLDSGSLGLNGTPDPGGSGTFTFVSPIP